MDPHRYVLRPGRAGLRDGDTGVDQERAPRVRPGLRELLGGEHAQGEAGVEGVTRQLPGGAHAALGDLAEADPLDVGATLLQRAEDAPLEEVRGVDRVPAARSLSLIPRSCRTHVRSVTLKG